jgi:hypothetical protein
MGRQRCCQLIIEDVDYENISIIQGRDHYEREGELRQTLHEHTMTTRIHVQTVEIKEMYALGVILPLMPRSRVELPA